MEVDASATLKDQLQRQDTFLQVLNIEKQLLALIHKKGVLHKDVQELYLQVRAGYESIILTVHDVVELPEVEHFLWKLHYKHIDEFRKSIRHRPTSGEGTKGEPPRFDTEAYRYISRHIEAFKSFLSEAAEFYQNLIKRFREICGVPGELFIHKTRASLEPIEPMKLSKCQFTCHRFLICLGDLARYGELFKKQDAAKWSVAFTYYIEASRIWPASGNPHNQLALLATYVNDSFLALYHCTRSLAVTEPFPDAWNNLMLLFNESSSSHVTLLSNEEQLNFLKPYEKILLQSASHSGDGSSDNSNSESINGLSLKNTDLWPLSVRLISFFLGSCSLKEFPCILSSIVKHLEALVQLDHEQLFAALESYKPIDSSRKGPFRALQFVSVFIFIVHSLCRGPQGNNLNRKDQKESSLAQLAIIATFICIARLVERCKLGNQLEKCPLLPSVMVFVEWLAGALDTLEAYATDEKVICSMSYFFHALTDLLNRLNITEEAEFALDRSALWEDHELRGYEPMGHVHSSLDFTTHWEWTENLNCKRSRRIFHSGMRIADQSSFSRQWICFDRKGMTFYMKDCQKENHRNVQEEQKESSGQHQAQFCQSSLQTSPEEEEVILFEPIRRHNSAPLDKYMGQEDHLSVQVLEPSKSADECLRQATSMFIEQSQSQSTPCTVASDASSMRYNNPVKQQEALPKESPTYPAGPPSLNAWVFDKENSDYELGKGIRSFNKHELGHIQEVAVESLASLLLDNSKDSVTDSVRVSTSSETAPPYVAPVPSAPLLPDDATWYRGSSPGFVDYNSSVVSREADGILGAAPIRVSAPHGPLEFSPVLPGLVHGYPPILGMSSSEWLYHYRNNHKLEQANTHVWPVNLNGPGLPLSSFHTSEISRFDLFNQWGNHLVSAPAFYMESPQLHHPGSSLVYGAAVEGRADNLISYQRPSSFVCGAVTDNTGAAAQQPLLQYLKEKEWQLHSPHQLRGSTFLGS